MYKRILVPIDGSEAAKGGLRQAVQLAAEQGAQLCIVHVVEAPILVAPEMYGVLYSQIADAAREGGAALLAGAQSVARESGVAAETQLLEGLQGSAGERIVSAAKAWQADLIVCGTHGRRGLRRIVLGSDAEFIVRQTPVPILLVRHDDSQK